MAQPLHRARKPLRVLIADDNPDMVLTTMMILSGEGHDVRTANDGHEAMVQMAEFDPDVVIADIKMPGLTGWELARAVRKVSDQGRPLLIAVSGHYTKGADRVLSEMAGFDHFLPKPFDPADLLALLAALGTARI